MKKLLIISLLALSSIVSAEEGTVIYIDDTIIEKTNRLDKIPSMAAGIYLGALTAYLIPQFNAISRIGIGTAAGVTSGYVVNQVIEHNKLDEIVHAYTITIRTDERIVCVVQEDLNGITTGSKVTLVSDKKHGRF